MEVIALVGKLRESAKFKEWHSANSSAKFVHIFLMVEPGKDTLYDIGFFDYEKSLMTSFVVDAGLKSIEVSESKEVFSEDPQKIKPIDESRVKVHFDDAIKTAAELQASKYKAHTPMKEVVILQNLEVGQVWNITYVTNSFQTLNIKVDAENGKVLDDKLHQIFSMG
ncbi:hypothetical protein ACFL3V_02675 [Nanoarchaeota archaeon]